MATAISIYSDLKAANPDDLNLQHAMVLVAIRQQKYPEAKQLIRAAIEKHPLFANIAPDRTLALGDDQGL